VILQFGKARRPALIPLQMKVVDLAD